MNFSIQPYNYCFNQNHVNLAEMDDLVEMDNLKDMDHTIEIKNDLHEIEKEIVNIVDSLPLEINSLIFSGFHPSDLNAMMRTSKLWNNIISDDIFWKEIGKKFSHLSKEILSNKQQIQECIGPIKYNAKDFKHIDLVKEISDHLNGEKIENIEILRNIPEIRNYLILEWIFRDNTNYLPTLFKELNSLQLCDLAFKMFLLNSKRDHSLYDAPSIDYIPGAEDIKLTSFLFKKISGCYLTHFESLTHIDLSCNKIDTIDDDIESWFPNLETLFLGNNLLTEHEVIKISNLKNLKKLDLSKNKIARLPLEILKLGNTLQELNVEGNINLSIPANFWFSRLAKITKGVSRQYPIHCFLSNYALDVAVTAPITATFIKCIYNDHWNKAIILASLFIASKIYIYKFLT